MLRDRCLCIRILFFGLDLRDLIVDCGLRRLKFLQLRFGRGLLGGELRSVHRAVLPVDGQRLVVGVARLLHVVILLCGRVARLDEALVVVLLERLEIRLRLLELVRVLRFEHEHRVAHVDLLAGLDQDAGDLAGLLDGDVIDLAGLDGAAAADAGVDGAGGGLLRRDLGQGGIHDRLGKEGQHQQDRQKNDGRGLDPFAFSYTVFHVSFLILSQSQNVRCLPPDTPRRAETAADRGSYR